MTREATQLEKREWWLAYGLELRKFVIGGMGLGIVHWMAHAYVPPQGESVLVRVCDLIWADFRTLPNKEVSCMACIAMSCEPVMMGGIR